MLMKYVQWAYGGMDIGTMMLLIEDSTEDEDKKMQSGISSLDTCTQTSLFFSQMAVVENYFQFMGNSQVVWMSATLPPKSWDAAKMIPTCLKT
jgi:hypothetical protein